MSSSSLLEYSGAGRYSTVESVGLACMSYCSISRTSVISVTKIYLEHNGDRGENMEVITLRNPQPCPARSPTTQDSGIVLLDPSAGVCTRTHQQGYTDCHCGQEASWDSPDLHFCLNSPKEHRAFR